MKNRCRYDESGHNHFVFASPCLFFGGLLILFFSQQLQAMSFFNNENALEIEKVSNNVFAVVGKRGPMTKKDLGTNATFGFILHDNGVIVVDPGASYLGAKRIYHKIRKITDKPITHVINTGSGSHRWLGNAFYKKSNVNIIASNAAVIHQKKIENNLLTQLSSLLTEDGMKGTTPLYADITFDFKKTLSIGKRRIELIQVGPAYAPGDTLVWLPDQKILFSGDVISVDRLPAIAASSNTTRWLEVFNTIEALEPEKIIPGHGNVSNLQKAKKSTKDYIVDLRKGVRKLLQNEGELDEVSKIDQSKYKDNIGFSMLSGRNAHQVFQELEWE